MTSPKLLIPMAIILVFNKFVDQTDPDVINMLRVFFCIGQVLMLALWAGVFQRIQSSEILAKTEFSVTPSQLNPPNPLATAMGVPDPHSGEPAQKMTHKEYDMKLWKTAFMGQIMQCVIVGGIHYKWGTVMPLVMSVIMALINAPSNPLVRLHIFGEDPSGLSPDKAAEITRPFSPAKSPFGSMMAGMQQQNQGETPAVAADTKTKADKKND